jgi:hypothetical protein
VIVLNILVSIGLPLTFLFDHFFFRVELRSESLREFGVYFLLFELLGLREGDFVEEDLLRLLLLFQLLV